MDNYEEAIKYYRRAELIDRKVMDNEEDRTMPAKAWQDMMKPLNIIWRLPTWNLIIFILQ